jgi:hypothetical protein
MFIQRSTEIHKVEDFVVNVQKWLNDNLIAYECCENGEVIGWDIKELRRKAS